MPPEDNTGAPAAAPAITIEPTAAPQAAEIVSGAAAAPAAVVIPLATEAAPAAAPEAPKLEPHTDTPSLLATATTVDKPADAAAAAPATVPGVEAPKPVVADPAAVPAPAIAAEPIKFEPFTLPEGMAALPQERVDEFTGIVTNPELTPQARGQALLDLHMRAAQEFQAQTLQEQHRAFSSMRADWRKEVMADEELGGAGHQTAMNAVARMRDMLVPEKHRAAFMRAMDLTGAGDHPEILRAFHNAARFFDEPAPLHEAGRPTPDRGRRTTQSHGGFYDTTTSGRPTK